MRIWLGFNPFLFATNNLTLSFMERHFHLEFRWKQHRYFVISDRVGHAIGRAPRYKLIQWNGKKAK